jgi:hypothetical protein
MMDGVIPEGNISDDPDTWSPSLSDMEDAADDVVHGRQSGEVRFLRAGGDNLLLQVEALPGAQNSSFEVGESSSRLNSMIVIPSPDTAAADPFSVLHTDALGSFGVVQFKLLFAFLSNNIYSIVQFLLDGEAEPVLPLVFMEEHSLENLSNFSTEFRDNILVLLCSGWCLVPLAWIKFLPLLYPTCFTLPLELGRVLFGICF